MMVNDGFHDDTKNGWEHHHFLAGKIDYFDWAMASIANCNKIPGVTPQNTNVGWPSTTNPNVRSFLKIRRFHCRSLG